MLQFFLSSTPLCFGLCGVVNSRQMHSFAQKFVNSFDTFSPTLSLLRVFTFFLIYFSINALNTNFFEKTSSFFCMKKIQHFLHKSLIKITQYLCFSMEAIEKGPKMSKWTRSKIGYDMLSQRLKVDLTYFLNVQPLHTSCW